MPRIDIEVGLSDHKIHDIGALRDDGATFHKASKKELFDFVGFFGGLIVGNFALVMALFLAKVK